MRRTLFVLSILAVLVFSVAQLAAAQWKANQVTNQTDENVDVIHSTWRPAKEDIPNGFRTRGHYRLAPGETRQFYAWSDNSIYFRILRSGEAIKPNVDKVTFSFWVHPSRSFMIVSDELSAAVKFSDLSYVNRSREGFVREDGFMKYSNGSVVNITSGWVSVVPDAPGAGDGVGPGATTTPTPPQESPAPPEGMVLIPAGEFEMGSNDADSYWDKPHIHTVYVDAFYMDTHEVTNADFQRFVLANPQWQKSRIPDNLHGGNYLRHWDDFNNYPAGKANHPVVWVSWYGAVAYAKWAGKRLPTEAEWEKAARGGKSGLKYPWGNTISHTHANYGNNVGGTTAVGAYPANGYGLYDMAGNVYEWCLDAYDGNFYVRSPARNPVSDVNTLSNIFLILNNYTQIKMSRVFRGGNCYDTAQDVRVAHRNAYSPPASNSGLGFRCARSVSPSDAGDGVGTGATPPVPSVTPPSPEAAAAPEGMVLIPAGEFEMGSNDADSYPDEQPVHTVYVDAFYMDTHEVTNAEFKRFVLANPQWQKSRMPHNLHNQFYLFRWSSPPNYPRREANHPVAGVFWHAAVAYAKWAGKRLPTEAEWEKAARGGKSGLKYPWGNTISRTRANYGGYLGGTYTVGRYPANGYGLYDMVGNVWEWCLDAYDKNFYTISPTSNPLSGASSIQWLLANYAEIKTKRVLRGGSWSDLFSAERKARVAYRFGGTPTGAHYLRGFRCAKSVSP